MTIQRYRSGSGNSSVLKPAVTSYDGQADHGTENAVGQVGQAVDQHGQVTAVSCVFDSLLNI